MFNVATSLPHDEHRSNTDFHTAIFFVKNENHIFRIGVSDFKRNDNVELLVCSLPQALLSPSVFFQKSSDKFTAP